MTPNVLFLYIYEDLYLICSLYASTIADAAAVLGDPK